MDKKKLNTSKEDIRKTSESLQTNVNKKLKPDKTPSSSSNENDSKTFMNLNAYLEYAKTLIASNDDDCDDDDIEQKCSTFYKIPVISKISDIGSKTKNIEASSVKQERNDFIMKDLDLDIADSEEFPEELNEVDDAAWLNWDEHIPSVNEKPLPPEAISQEKSSKQRRSRCRSGLDLQTLLSSATLIKGHHNSGDWWRCNLCSYRREFSSFVKLKYHLSSVHLQPKTKKKVL